MNWSRLVVSLCLLIGVIHAAGVGYTQSEIRSYNFMGKSNNSTLYNVTLTNDPYEYPIYVVDLWGSRHQIGYDYGALMGNLIKECYELVFANLFTQAGIPPALDPTFELAAGLFLDWQWNDWLSKQVPDEYIQEIDGIEDGGRSIGIHGLKRYITRTIVLANLPSDMSDLRFVFLEEYQQKNGANSNIEVSNQELIEMMRKAVAKLPSGFQCSMFGVWGSRTVNGELYSARNLDWSPNLGLDKYKTIQVWHPDGAYEHAAVGYTVVYGVLAGMSAKGLSAHEANLEVNQETFEGFPWILRLRYIMENAASISEAWQLWEMTNNTVGFNHMIASSTDATGNYSHAALVIETMAQYDAFFLDNDPREASATIVDYDTGKPVRYGFPLPNALWRTNHGYDPTIREHYMWRNMSAGQWSMERYMFAYDAFTYYEKSHIAIDHLSAINITAILGDKGHHAYQCTNNTDGSNIISATFHPQSQSIWAAWENGQGETWRPACCNNYVHFDMSKWFTQKPNKV